MGTNSEDIELVVNEECSDGCPINLGDDQSTKLDESLIDEVAEETTDEESKLQQQINELNDRNLRLMAEYDNFRKRSAKERQEFYSDATARTINEILPVVDNFERALLTESTDENFKKGVELIFNQFIDILKKMNVEEINPVGEVFDPNIANAVNQITDENLGENIVAQVFQKGYKIGDKIIRYAMVVVANT